MSRSRRREKDREQQELIPGYAISCLGDLRLFAKNMAQAGTAPGTVATVEGIIESISAGVRFVMPNGGRIFDGGISSKMLPAFHAPYPRMTIEYDVPVDDVKPSDPYHGLAVPARVVVLVENDDASGTTIWPINFVRGIWVPNWCGAFVPYEQEIVGIAQEEVDAEHARMSAAGFVDSSGKTPRILGFRVVREAVPLGEFGMDCAARMAREGLDVELAFDSDTMHEMIAALQLCAALSCSNVRPQEITYHRGVQRRGVPREDYSYNVLVLGPERSERHGGLGGHHAAPRTHLRRGHIRHLPWSGANVWVNSCVVGASGRGLVDKTYVVRR